MQRLKDAVARLNEVSRQTGAFRNDAVVVTAIIRLDFAATRWDRPEDAMQSIRDAHTAIGNPGKWGYGTDEGDAVRDLYEAYNDTFSAEAAPTSAA